jgi:hypothetical protein
VAESQEPAKKSIPTRGIPSNESIYLPAHNSPEIRRFQDDSENGTRNVWQLAELVNFIFPSKYQKVYNSIALKFISKVIEKLELNSEDISGFVKENGISKATFYNRILPRLRRVGMIKLEREIESDLKATRKRRRMRISLSRTFGNYFSKIGESWLALVDDARSASEQDKQRKL